jgi:hypothetical protein
VVLLANMVGCRLVVGFVMSMYCLLTHKRVMKVIMPHSLESRHVPLLSCLVPAELHLFLKAIPSAAAAVCEQKAFQLQNRLTMLPSAILSFPQ